VFKNPKYPPPSYDLGLSRAIFYPRDAGASYGPVSVRMFVTCRSSIETAERIELVSGV